MTYKTLEFLKNCTSEEEARMKCDLIGVHFDRKQFMEMASLEPWMRTLWLYNIDCKERGLQNVLN